VARKCTEAAEEPGDKPASKHARATTHVQSVPAAASVRSMLGRHSRTLAQSAVDPSEAFKQDRASEPDE
jgi:hypothetical protein